VGRAADVEALVDSAVRAYGRLDIACNNAGVAGPHLVFTADFPEEDWDRVIGTNLKGVWLCLKHEIPEMLRRGGEFNGQRVFDRAVIDDLRKGGDREKFKAYLRGYIEKGGSALQINMLDAELLKRKRQPNGTEKGVP
jgi:NAD(P)-dependent dehydrogenase (short-subunit alcohol dehydrogenase family)